MGWLIEVNLIFLEVFFIKQDLPINQNIRAREVNLIDEQGQKLGTMELRKAQEIADEKKFANAY